jgi:hypothetical protein
MLLRVSTSIEANSAAPMMTCTEVGMMDFSVAMTRIPKKHCIHTKSAAQAAGQKINFS